MNGGVIIRALSWRVWAGLFLAISVSLLMFYVSDAPSPHAQTAHSYPVRIDPTGTTRQPVNPISGQTGVEGGSGTVTALTQRVVEASDAPAVATRGHGATGAAPPSGATQIGGVTSGATGGYMQPITVCTEFANISQTANAQVITGVSGRRVYICAFNLVTATAQNVAIVAGTGTVCATTTVAVPGTSGGATAATGWNFAANTGIAHGSGFGAIAKTTVNGDNVCVFQSGSGQLSGGLTYAIY